MSSINPIGCLKGAPRKTAVEALHRAIRIARGDIAENSIMQTVGVTASMILTTTVMTFAGWLVQAAAAQTAELHAQMDASIAARFVTTDFSGAREFENAEASSVTMRDAYGTCITYTVAGKNLVRTHGSCDDDKFAEQSSVLVGNLTEGSGFTYRNIAGRELVNREPQGDCDPFFTDEECDSTIPATVTLDAVTKNPISGSHSLRATAATEAVQLEIVTSDTSDVTFYNSTPTGVEGK